MKREEKKIGKRESDIEAINKLISPERKKERKKERNIIGKRKKERKEL